MGGSRVKPGPGLLVAVPENARLRYAGVSHHAGRRFVGLSAALHKRPCERLEDSQNAIALHLIPVTHRRKNALDPPMAGRFIRRGGEGQREQEPAMADAAPQEQTASEIDIEIGGMACVP
jgi:hypothetical protein